MITVAIPSIPGREAELARALASVEAQTVAPHAVVVEVDHERAGALVTRNRALARVDTEWTAFLDDDDELLPEHLEACAEHADRTGADLVYPWFVEPEPHWDRRLAAFGRTFDSMAHLLVNRNWIPVTVLARTALLREVGGFQWPPQLTGLCEDWGAWQALHRAGGRIVHLPRKTWVWHRHPGQTRGRADLRPRPGTAR